MATRVFLCCALCAVSMIGIALTQQDNPNKPKSGTKESGKPKKDAPDGKLPIPSGNDVASKMPAGYDTWWIPAKSIDGDPSAAILLMKETNKKNWHVLYHGVDLGIFKPVQKQSFKNDQGYTLAFQGATKAELTASDGQSFGVFTKGEPTLNPVPPSKKDAPSLILPAGVQPATQRVIVDGDWSFPSGNVTLQQTETGFTITANSATQTFTRNSDQRNVYQPAKAKEQTGLLWVFTAWDQVQRITDKAKIETGTRTSGYPIPALPFGLVPARKAADPVGTWISGENSIKIAQQKSGEGVTANRGYNKRPGADIQITADPVYPNVYRAGGQAPQVWVMIDPHVLVTARGETLEIWHRDGHRVGHHLHEDGGFSAARDAIDFGREDTTWQADSGTTLTLNLFSNICQEGKNSKKGNIGSNFSNFVRLIFDGYYRDLIFVDANTAIEDFDTCSPVIYRRTPPVAVTPRSVQRGSPATTIYHVSVKAPNQRFGTPTVTPINLTLSGQGQLAMTLRTDKLFKEAYRPLVLEYAVVGDVLAGIRTASVSQPGKSTLDDLDRIEIEQRKNHLFVPCKGSLSATPREFDLSSSVLFLNDLNTFAEVFEITGDTEKSLGILPPDATVAIPRPFVGKSWAARTRFEKPDLPPLESFKPQQLNKAPHGVVRITLANRKGNRMAKQDTALYFWEDQSRAPILPGSDSFKVGLGTMEFLNSHRAVFTQASWGVIQPRRSHAHDHDRRNIYVGTLGKDVAEVDLENNEYLHRDGKSFAIKGSYKFKQVDPPVYTLAGHNRTPIEVLRKIKEMQAYFPVTYTDPVSKKSYESFRLQEAYREFDKVFEASQKKSFAQTYSELTGVDYAPVVNRLFLESLLPQIKADKKDLYRALNGLIVDQWLTNRALALQYFDRYDNLVNECQNFARDEINIAKDPLSVSGKGDPGGMSLGETEVAVAKAVVGVVEIAIGVKGVMPASEPWEWVQTLKDFVHFDTLKKIDGGMTWSGVKDVGQNLLDLVNDYKQAPAKSNVKQDGLDGLYLTSGQLLLDFRDEFACSRAAVAELRILVLKDVNLVREVAGMENEALAMDSALQQVPTSALPQNMKERLIGKMPPCALTSLPAAQLVLARRVWNSLLPSRLGIFSRYVRDSWLTYYDSRLFYQFEDFGWYGYGTKFPDHGPFRKAVMTEFDQDPSNASLLTVAYSLDVHDYYLYSSFNTKRGFDDRYYRLVHYVWEARLIPTDMSSGNNVAEMPDQVTNRLLALGYSRAELRQIAEANGNAELSGIYVAPAYQLLAFGPAFTISEVGRRCKDFQRLQFLYSTYSGSSGANLVSYGPDGWGNRYQQPWVFLRD